MGSDGKRDVVDWKSTAELVLKDTSDWGRYQLAADLLDACARVAELEAEINRELDDSSLVIEHGTNLIRTLTSEIEQLKADQRGKEESDA